MIFWRYNVADYKVGDPLFVGSAGYAHTIREYVVTRVTAKGQLVAKLNNHEIRILPSGRIVGQGAWGDRVMSAESAVEAVAEHDRTVAWRAIARQAEELVSLAYKVHQDSAFEKFAELAQAIEARRAETAKTGSVEDESAVGNADAPNPPKEQSDAR